MTSKEAIEKKIDELKSLADEIETGALKLIQETPLEYEPEGPSYAPSPSFYRWKMVPR